MLDQFWECPFSLVIVIEIRISPCQLFIFVSREGHGGTIGLAFVDRLCKGYLFEFELFMIDLKVNFDFNFDNKIRYQGANMGFVLFNHKTNNDDKHIETKFIFAHEVMRMMMSTTSTSKLCSFDYDDDK